MDHGDIEDPDVQMPQIKGTPLPKQARVVRNNYHVLCPARKWSNTVIRFVDELPRPVHWPAAVEVTRHGSLQASAAYGGEADPEREKIVLKRIRTSKGRETGDAPYSERSTGNITKKSQRNCRAANKMTNKVLVPNQDWC
ncbi:predicted protein [Coccidioides posadasii str. Silveira]|uniref:Predicted protein n=2 Tax=Coccidioides posadasii TaxID=199306 RepID=E9D122_COCPS|nr:predicted protein [Coccidioides posadasii str. Silveira]KMM73404.1 hypothetical protein CPAG_09693 [Coccidioides posadasii RMSCC 3488]